MARLLKNTLPMLKSVRAGSSAVTVPSYITKLAGREVIGFGHNGEANYVDRSDFPMPSVRFGKKTPAIRELQEKEKGDWKKLSMADKKALYRYSFCQTLAEVEAPTGEWKSILGFSLILISSSLWLFMFTKFFGHNPELPESFSENRKRAQLRRILDLKMDPIEGISSKWDYENDKWK
ncbi:cytochrome c oxidase subunit 4 isoform 1, mitochondrial [Cimex lectularius]|uniref:Cytochrome c oxidase subunit 4 n=1 Tax=Cimex lectularius TaxID=79782 RepID=A0A8I6SFY1_CIMLE|nr:cytochrome c oxidase subunit 4 isoform 1, mitochondrial [Cimex lectularius]XP_024082589.1 cytochrome c oxidase subunit 4 isoform 1, mitochondrial [Cimex lectularius]